MEEQSVERAQALIELGRAGDARTMLARILAVEPEDVEALLALSLAQGNDDPGASLETARRVLSLDPEDVQALLLCTDASLELDRVTDAVHYARLAVAEAPWLAAAQAGLAHALGRRHPEEAREAARRAIELDPENAIGYVAAASIEMAQGEWKAAERWLRKALEVDPSGRTGQVNLVTVQEASGQIAGAFGGAAGLLGLDPSDSSALKVLHDTVYTTLVHLLWVATVLLGFVAFIRSE